MRFHIANKAPIFVTLGDTSYALKRIRRPFWVRWSAELDAKRTEESTTGLTPLERAKLLLIYTIEPTMHSELSKRIYTTEGTGRIITEAALNATPPMPQAVLDAWLEDADEKDLETLALALASLVDLAELRESKSADGNEGTGEPDPLASLPRESNDSSKTS